ncbi:sensor domain-containing diguanylate cyclase [Qipengyuania soli]|uniref:diguanylate cyclase n=1 Tax=Qipengyuania soli TaxID=2782568 RepID=A0A7S8F1W7_9SPHN|nr:diguanylate cyclase [Qipengyuania soli]QPC98885.1 diguanylate cyclase [Qipengyuania soli]
MYRIIGILLASLLALCGVEAMAAPTSSQERCSLTLDSAPAASALASLAGWHCPAEFSVEPERFQVLRIDLSSTPDRGSLKHAISRKADFSSLTFVTVDQAGAIRMTRSVFADGQQAFLDRQFSLPVPVITDQTQTFYAIMEGGTETMPLDYLRLEHRLPGSSAEDRNVLLVFALVIGVLLMPMLIDAGVYHVLRERFSLFHIAMIGSTLVHLVTVSGLNIPLFALDLPTSRMLGVASFGGILIAANLFTGAFLEHEYLPRNAAKIFRLQAALVALATLLHSPHLPALGSLPATVFYVACFATSPYFVWATWQAWRKGSRSARFLAIGFAPLVIVGLIRTVSHLVPGMPTYDAGALFLLGVVLEVVATTFGVADRFLVLRHERDKVKAEAEGLAQQARHDPLTGVLNRRAMTDDFAGLVAKGYTSVALLDLDRFKSINDEFGHAMGDEVLKASAQALSGDAEARVVRMGGEEFLLLLRGPDARQRAEARRRAITARILAEIDGLDRPVTASMGFLDFSAVIGESEIDFATIYSRADQLLYSAKCDGRNRMVHERLELFQPQVDQRGAAAA